MISTPHPTGSSSRISGNTLPPADRRQVDKRFIAALPLPATDGPGTRAAAAT